MAEGLRISAALQTGARGSVWVLEHDPELGAGLEPERFQLAVQRLQAPMLRLARGSWATPRWPEAVRRGPGLLVLDGFVVRQVEIGGRTSAELLSAGDVVRPWQREDSITSIPGPGWRALERSRLAVLGLDFARRLAPFPEVQSELVGRTLRRSRRLVITVAIVHQPRVAARVQLMLWQLADRFGTVRQDDVLLPLRLTRPLLADFVAARRPTVSAAVASLERAGALSRAPGGSWLLHGKPPGDSLS